MNFHLIVFVTNGSPIFFSKPISSKSEARDKANFVKAYLGNTYRGHEIVEVVEHKGNTSIDPELLAIAR